MSDHSSAESGDSTTDSTVPDSTTSSSVSPTSGADPCSPITGPECPSTRTWHESGQEVWTETLPMLYAHEGKEAHTLICYAEVSPAKICPSPANAEDSTATDPGSSSSSPESSTLFDPDSFSSRTYPVSSLAKAVGTLEQSLERWPTSGTAWDGGFSTHVTSECRSDDAGCSSSEPSLTEILESPHTVPAKYSLSARAARGILRRAQNRGRELPSHLRAALETVARP